MADLLIPATGFKTEKFPEFSWAALWIYVSAWASVSGWILSSLKLLNRTGYVLSLLILTVILWKTIPIHSIKINRFLKIRNRMKHFLPAIFFGLVVLVFVGGALYAPNNYDYLTYRFPRVLRWTSEQTWYWSHTRNPRINYQAPGFEWLMTPLFVFFKTDRLFFLINFFSFCLLPGLIFSVFNRLGISRRNCWTWMWLLPAGYCYVLQAGSVGNDAFGAVYFLAALHFALIAREKGSLRSLFLSWLAICLLTGAKLSNVPLVAPWLVLVWPLLKRAVIQLRSSVPAIIVGLLISILPVIMLNLHYSGEWTGDPINSRALRIRNPAIGIIGNFFQLGVGNLVPPLFPWANEWNRRLSEISILKKEFPRFSLKVGEIQMEERAGIGFGLTFFLLFVLVFSTKDKKPIRSNFAKLFAAAVLLSVLTFMAKWGPPSAARLFAPYYAVLIGAALLLARPEPSRTPILRSLGVIAALSAVPLLILSPSRPLWPAVGVSNVLHQKYAGNRYVERVFQVYSVYHNRSDSLAPLRTWIPDSEKAIGLMGSGDDPESSLWIPFGSRKVVELFPEDNPCDHGVTTVVIHEAALSAKTKSWLIKNGGEFIGKEYLTTKVSVGPEYWYVEKLKCSP